MNSPSLNSIRLQRVHFPSCTHGRCCLESSKLKALRTRSRRGIVVQRQASPGKFGLSSCKKNSFHNLECIGIHRADLFRKAALGVDRRCNPSRRKHQQCNSRTCIHDHQCKSVPRADQLTCTSHSNKCRNLYIGCQMRKHSQC